MLKKIILTLFFLFFLALGAALVNINKIAEGILLRAIASAAGSKLTVKTLQIDMRKGKFLADGIVLEKTPASSIAGSIAKARVSIDLISLIRRKVYLKSLSIENANLDYFNAKSASGDKEREPKSSAGESGMAVPDLEITIDEASITESNILYHPADGVAALSVQIPEVRLNKFKFKNMFNFGGTIFAHIAINNGQSGRINIDGSFAQLRKSAKTEAALTVEALDLPAIARGLSLDETFPLRSGTLSANINNRYADKALDLSGLISVEGVSLKKSSEIADAILAQNNGRLDIHLSGSGHLQELAVNAWIADIDFAPFNLSPDRVKIGKINYAMLLYPKTGKFKIKSVIFDRPELIIFRKSSRKSDHQGSSGGSQPAQGASATPQTQQIELLQVRDGQVTYYDPGLSTGPLINANNINIEITNLYLPYAYGKEADIVLSAVISEGYGEVLGKGSFAIEPDAVDFELKGQVTGVPLLYLEPFYRDKLGGIIADGAVSVYSQARAKKNFLNSRHSVSIENLRLSPQSEERRIFGLAPSEVVQFLRSKDGNINVAFDLNGDIRNPKFSFNVAFRKALLSNIGKSLFNFQGSEIIQNIGGELLSQGQGIGKEAAQTLTGILSGEKSTKEAEEALKQTSKEIKSLFQGLLDQK